LAAFLEQFQTPEDSEAGAILARVERELGALEARADRLMYRYGL
jgi:hypothetical protein